MRSLPADFADWLRMFLAGSSRVSKILAGIWPISMPGSIEQPLLRQCGGPGLRRLCRSLYRGKEAQCFQAGSIICGLSCVALFKYRLTACPSFNFDGQGSAMIVSIPSMPASVDFRAEGMQLVPQAEVDWRAACPYLSPGRSPKLGVSAQYLPLL